VLTRLQGGFAAIVVTLLALGLIVLDLTDRGFREWWAGRALTSDLVAGLLVLSITLLVVDQLVGRRQIADRSRAVAAQVAIVMNQATLTAAAASSALGGSDSRDAASDEVRTYTLMLLVVAPLLIEAPASRGFLEQAQRLAGELERVLRALATTADPSTISRARLDDAVTRLRELSKPLLEVLDLEAFFAADADGQP
jgi:small-conductance mechanosensitive channel